MTKILVEFQSIEEAQTAIAAVNTGDVAVGVMAAAPPAAAPPAAAPPAAAPPAAAPPAAAPPAAAAGAVTQQQVFAAVQAFADVHGAAATKAKFPEVGATKTSDIPPEQFANCLTVFAV